MIDHRSKTVAAIALGVIAALVGCSRPNSAEPEADAKLDSGEVALLAQAPDGTRLWAVDTGYRVVYFASSGASWSEACGKNCTRDVDVPTVDHSHEGRLQ